MSDESKRKADAFRASMMSTERPLDALLPELTTQAPPLPRSVLHPRVMELGPGEGNEWVIALWGDPGSTRALHEEVKKLVEATLLAALCRPANTGEALDNPPGGIRLLAFSPVNGNMQQALRAFGFQLQQELPWPDERLELLRSEGLEMGWDVPATPVSNWFAPLLRPEGVYAEKIEGVHRLLRERVGDDFWGNIPGAFSRCAANLFVEHFQEELTPDLNGLRSFELLTVERKRSGGVRWIPPILFQALADFIGVVIQAEWQHGVEWALCEVDESGYAPPPLFRITRPDRQEHLPIGVHLLRWCIMPIMEGEEIPSLDEWLESEFATAPRH